MSDAPAQIAHGPLFIGFMFNTALLGTLTGQVHHYMITFKRDKMWMKAFVYTLYLANMINTVFMAEFLYHSLINHYSDSEYLARANWVFATDPALTGIIALMVQLFFAWRVRILTKSILTTIPIVALTVAGTVAALASAVEVKKHPRFLDFGAFKFWVLFWLIGHSVADLMITLVLMSYICEFYPLAGVPNVLNIMSSRRRHRTGFPTSDKMVNRIIRSTVQTGLVTTVCACADVIVFLVNSNGNHLIFNLALAKLYSVTLMSSLNARKGWAFDSYGSDSNNTRSISAGPGRSISAGRRRKPNDVYVADHPQVFVNVESHQMRDVAPSESDYHDPQSEIDLDKRKDIV